MRSAQEDSHDANPAGTVNKSRRDRFVCMCVQLNRWFVVCVSVLQRVHNGEVCVFALTCVGMI